MKVAVIGAGPAGISAAYCLAKAGVAVDVYEASDRVGGLARTLELWGQAVDLGPHRFFTSDPRVKGLWREVVGSDYDMVDRLTRIFYRGRLFRYPLSPFDTVRKLGALEAATCVASYAKERAMPTVQDGTFEAWVVSRFGRRLFQTFFETYSEKLWGISCRELDADFAAQRIKGLDLYEAIRNALFRRGPSRPRTLVDRFAYPWHGTGTVYERMARFVTSHGGRVLLRTPVRRVVVEATRVKGVETADASFERYGSVVSSMPLPLLVKGLDGVPPAIAAKADALTFRSTILVYLNVDSTDVFPDNWLYVHSPELAAGRITNFRNWSPTLHRNEKTSILALEFWCNEGDESWTADDEQLAERAKRELGSTGLLRDAKILDSFVYRIKRCYPVYRRGYMTVLQDIQQYLDGIGGLIAVGRYGAFKYNNQDHSILAGILAAENLVTGAGHDLWAVNTDTEHYQEAAAWDED